MIEKRLKSTNTSYNHSQTKTHKSLAKHLTNNNAPNTIFSNKQQATSNKQQSGIKTRSPQTNSQLNTNFLTVNRTHKSKSPSLCVFYITPFKETATPAENAKDYKRMSYTASLKTSCVLGVLRG